MLSRVVYVKYVSYLKELSVLADGRKWAADFISMSPLGAGPGASFY